MAAPPDYFPTQNGHAADVPPQEEVRAASPVTIRLSREEVLEMEVRYLRKRDLEMQLKIIERDIECLLLQRNQGGANLKKIKEDLESYRQNLSRKYGIHVDRDTVCSDGTILFNTKGLG